MGDCYEAGDTSIFSSLGLYLVFYWKPKPNRFRLEAGIVNIKFI